MKFYSTRNTENTAGFKKAVLDCMPSDGGLYVPYDMADLRRWILYADEKTSFSSLAGALTSAMINDEFSPIICETIATRAFKKDPVFKQLDENLFLLELYNGETGTFKDYGVSYLTAALETILQLDGEKAILLDATTGELGACMARALRDKNLLKSVLVSPKGSLRGLEESDFVWNGGNIFPVEVDGTIEDCRNLVRKIFADRGLVEKYHLTVANTANIGRLLPQAFFYTFAFSRLKKIVNGDIYYAFSAGNYGNLISGLYGWRFALPVNGFIVPSTPLLTQDPAGNCMVTDSVVPIEDRIPADPASPSNLERLEQVFNANSLMIRSFVFPALVSEQDTNEACKELFVKYKVYADRDTSAAYAAAKKRSDVTEDGDGAVVLVAREDPSIDVDFLLHNLGECPDRDVSVAQAFTPVKLDKPCLAPDDVDSLISILNSLNLRRMF
ncbi:pyridoxal-phosphate dependent enzyme [Treponema sp.]|uniref:pyridoxal-phosphate dependent enzyme n=1 Tax=Treponema sp. TaxID=166 RepID=UPI00298E1B1B|nr:pyridoxal-phosphate dependent enzyme [Treponema sp.]MCQ2240208.1 pyridoxal-phosphate dependent enzyme [Treponema sp.]